MSLAELWVACQSVEGAVPVLSPKERGRCAVRTPRSRTRAPQPLLHPCDEPSFSVSPEPSQSRGTTISSLNVDGRWNRRCMSTRPQAVEVEAYSDLALGSLTPPLQFFVSTPKELTAVSMPSPRDVGWHHATTPHQVDPLDEADTRSHAVGSATLGKLPTPVQDCEVCTPVMIESLVEEVDLIEDEVSIFEAPDISVQPLPEATCIASVFHTVDFAKLMWQQDEKVNAPLEPNLGHPDVHACEGTIKLPHSRDYGRPPASMFPRLGYFNSVSSHDAESHTTASVQLDQEGTDSALSTASSHCDGQSGSGCKVVDVEVASHRHLGDDRLEEEPSSTKVLWSHLSHERPRGDSSVPLTAEPIVEGMRVETDRRERHRPRLPGLRAPKVDGPPMSPRAPFCAARGFFQTDGFVFSDLDLPGDMSGESEGGFSRTNSMTADCPISRVNSLAVSIADEESSSCRAPKEAANSRGRCSENLAERLASMSSPNGEGHSLRPDQCAIGYMSARIGQARHPGHMRKFAYEATVADPSRRRNASPWPLVDVSKSTLTSSLGNHLAHMWRETTAQIAEAMTTYASSSEPFPRNA